MERSIVDNSGDFTFHIDFVRFFKHGVAGPSEAFHGIDGLCDVVRVGLCTGSGFRQLIIATTCECECESDTEKCHH